MQDPPASPPPRAAGSPGLHSYRASRPAGGRRPQQVFFYTKRYRRTHGKSWTSVGIARCMRRAASPDAGGRGDRDGRRLRDAAHYASRLKAARIARVPFKRSAENAMKISMYQASAPPSPTRSKTCPPSSTSPGPRRGEKDRSGRAGRLHGLSPTCSRFRARCSSRATPPRARWRASRASRSRSTRIPSRRSPSSRRASPRRSTSSAPCPPPGSTAPRNANRAQDALRRA